MTEYCPQIQVKWCFVFLGKSGGTETRLGGSKIDLGWKDEDHSKKFETGDRF